MCDSRALRHGSITTKGTGFAQLWITRSLIMLLVVIHMRAVVVMSYMSQVMLCMQRQLL